MTDAPQNSVDNGRNRGTQPGQRNRDCDSDRCRDGAVCFGTLYRQAPVGMCAIGFDPWRFKAVSDCMLDQLGYARQEFMQLAPSDLLTPTACAHFDRLCDAIRSGQRETLRIELELRCKDTSVLETLVAIRGILENGCFRGLTLALMADDTPQAVNPALCCNTKHFHALAETMAEGLALMDVRGQIVYVNRRLAHMGGYRTQELVGRNMRDVIAPQVSAPLEDILAGRHRGSRRSLEIEWAGKDGRRNCSRLSPQPLFDENDRLCGALAVVTDITAQKNAARILVEREKELQQKSDHLEEINTALQTLVKIREIDRTELEETVVANIHQLADPLLVRLKASGLNERQKSYVAILEANLHEVITPFTQQIATRYLELTPAEVEVANLVKHGRKSKEIGSLLNISTRTVEMHRRNIRKKLGLRNKHANLRTFLLSKSTA